MALYNLFDVLDTVSCIINDGFMYADISELPEDDDCPNSLYFSVPNPDDLTWSIDYEGIDSLPEEYDISKVTINVDNACFALSLKELSTVHHALTNALEYFKECAADKSCEREIRDEIKKSSIDCRNLQAKIDKILKRYSQF